MVHDVFICHAADDKTRGLTVWLDQFQIKLGDSLRRTIDEGLRESRFGVVILSPSFFAKHWSTWELNGLVDREVTTGKKVVLPVWHEVDHDAVAAYSPSLANKLAARTSDGIDAVADAVADVLGVPITEIEQVPRTAEEELALLRTKPEGWEYLLFASVLLKQLEALEEKYRDHQIRYVVPADGPSDASEAARFLGRAFGSASRLTSNVDRILDPTTQERAFGRPGEPGNSDAIEHLAQRLIDTYAGLLEWAAQLRNVSLPDEFEHAGELAASFVDRPIEQFREFVDTTVAKMDELPALLRAANQTSETETEPEAIRFEIDLVLSIDDRLVDDFNEEMQVITGWWRPAS
jgi:hypothetical protein